MSRPLEAAGLVSVYDPGTSSSDRPSSLPDRRSSFGCSNVPNGPSMLSGGARGSLPASRDVPASTPQPIGWSMPKAMAFPLIVDRYDRWVVAQLLSAGLETMRGDIVTAIADVPARGILLRRTTRHASARGSPVSSSSWATCRSHSTCARVRCTISPPWTGQKTGAFSTSARTECSSLQRQGRAAEDWTVSPTMDLSPCTSPRVAHQSWHSTRVPKRSSGAGRTRSSTDSTTSAGYKVTHSTCCGISIVVGSGSTRLRWTRRRSQSHAPRCRRRSG